MPELTQSEKLLNELKGNRPDLFTVNSKFVAKLSHVDRCSVLAFAKGGVKVPILSLAFGINRGTVRHITNSASPHYRAVRKEYVEDPERFMDTYITPEWRRKIELAAANSAEQMVTEKDLSQRPKGTTKRANSAEGLHSITHDELGNIVTRQFAVRFFETMPDGTALPASFGGAARPPGWYLLLQDADADKNTMLLQLNGSPLFGEPKDAATSAKALAGYLADTGGKEAEL